MARHSILTTLLACLCLALTARVHADPYSDGTRAFKAGKYESALKAFLEAQRQGYKSGELFYNLGASLFKLGRYEEAQTAFDKAADYPETRELSLFNMGLVADKLGDRKGAIDRFMQVLDETDDERLTRLAGTALSRLQDTTVQNKHAWFGLVSLDVGYDDNVTLLPDTLLVASSQQNDLFVDAYAYANRQLSGDEKQGLSFDTSLFLQKYQQLTRYDLADVNAGLGYQSDFSTAWRSDSGAHFDLSFLDGSAFMATTSLSTSARRSISEVGFAKLGYELARVHSMDPAYNYLTGWRHRFEIRPYWRAANGRLDLSYRLEWNDRRDRRDVLFSSYSPVRQRLRVKGRIDIGEHLGLTADLRYRYSRYREPDEISAGVFKRREESRYKASLILSRRYSNGKELSAEYDYTRNKSNISHYTYTGNVYMINLLLPW
ncbi:MAG: tetratricopeptide repeat protein [Gammaproteobacteria bacterium]|nr:tetratricopeptide repeat protein [Gammaproteobacteria bacterium]